MSTIDERFAAFVHDAIPYRELTVSISRSDERRLARLIAALNDDTPDEPPLSPHDSVDLAVAFTMCALDGLRVDEEQAGVWVDCSGRAFDLPRPVRAPWRHRCKFAWRAVRQTWAAT